MDAIQQILFDLHQVSGTLTFGQCLRFLGNIIKALLVSKTVENHAMAHAIMHQAVILEMSYSSIPTLILPAVGPRLHSNIWQ